MSAGGYNTSRILNLEDEESNSRYVSESEGTIACMHAMPCHAMRSIMDGDASPRLCGHANRASPQLASSHLAAPLIAPHLT